MPMVPLGPELPLLPYMALTLSKLPISTSLLQLGRIRTGNHQEKFFQFNSGGCMFMFSF